MREPILRLHTQNDGIIDIYREGSDLLIHDKTKGHETKISHATGMQTLNILGLLDPMITDIEEL